MNPVLVAFIEMEVFIPAPAWIMLLLKVTAILLVAWGAYFLLRRTNPHWQVLLWRVTASALILLPIFTWLLPSLDVRVARPSPVAKEANEITEKTIEPTVEPVAKEAEAFREATPVATNFLDEGVVDPPPEVPKRLSDTAMPPGVTDPGKDAGVSAVLTHHPGEQMSAPVAVPGAFAWFTWSGLCLAVWSCGILVLSLRFLVGRYRLSKVVRLAQPVQEFIDSECRRVAEAIGCRRRIEVLQSSRITSPLICGAGRPCLLLPSEICTQAYRADLTGILAHELTHLCSRDLIWNLVFQWVSILLWFHPLIWFLRKVHLAACELACDAMSARFVGDVADYCRALARVAIAVSGKIPASGIAMARRSSVLYRLNTLSKRVLPLPLRRGSVFGVGLVVLLSVLFLGALQLVPDDSTSSPDTSRSTVASVPPPSATAGKPEVAPNASKKTPLFTSISAVLKWYPQKQEIVIQGDGTCVYTIEGRPAAINEEKPMPAGRSTFKLRPEKLRELEELYQKRDWLTVFGKEGPGTHANTAGIELTLKHDGRTRNITCAGERTDNYNAFTEFFNGLFHQERMLYRIESGTRMYRSEAYYNLFCELEVLQGNRDIMPPVYDIDYTRYLQLFLPALREPHSAKTEDLRTAIALVNVLGMKSETKYLAKLAYDRECGVKADVARVLARFEGPQAVPVLAEMAESTEEARRQLIGMGEYATPAILDTLSKNNGGGSESAYHLIRAYLNYWLEIPGPIDPRIVRAVRRIVEKRLGKYGNEYYEQFLKQVESDPIPESKFSCLMDRWSNVSNPTSLQLVHGCYVVVDGRIVQYAAAPAPKADEKRFEILFRTNQTDNQLTLEMGWKPWRFLRPKSGKVPLKKVDTMKIDVPPESKFQWVFSPHHRSTLVSYSGRARILDRFRVLWEGHFVKDGKVIKRVVYVAKVVKPDGSVTRFEPPLKPAPTIGESVKPFKVPINLTYQGLHLNEDNQLTDPLLLQAIQVARKNYGIRHKGGDSAGIEETEMKLVYETGALAPNEERFTVFWAKERNVFCIQYAKADAKYVCKYFGPFLGDPFENLNLPRK